MSKNEFNETLKNKIHGSFFDRALHVLNMYGDDMALNVASVLLYAADQGPKKVEEVLYILEEHYRNSLQYQHPSIRGQIGTHGMFRDILSKTLGLTLV